ncbi:MULTISPECIES: HlyD family type I secretion periplasmic adaptor subunit [unclassified Bradyrhizobium]|uniref:HlyD family type I secretion periplasmic adaptor subunit n=1 Tax=unclassified Bradyrhizobium TaxID=2631580 RepID=UPI001FFA34C2|nr:MULTISPECIES: HlyD family type I secretion periplasmic adaptor subunit [unclassified Bradyrhizobium]MCK1292445.1 HlyD family type I secretion periplasmic adaptor subunit [Bradyrhizobium sp. 30]MCK1305017.1 HlyD family type I secretion periplasmic adaptor subunit [Bradyrhizobium sp. 45]MCK1312118.1 HlyD family type I secretion periplasmic adaptor subunit [Bradyrhizobium sp. 23]MCK1439814.1 HlyD family type I secretion periplasmic adaptor subunit [Bradyrhizobium sp. 15]MCK1607452.1 HlyD famil
MNLKPTERPARAAKQSFGIRSRVTMVAVLAIALIGGCGGWAVHAELTGAVIAQGKVAVRKQVKLIQHRDGGIVGEILVANGDAVKVGDVLVRLDETQTKAELGVLKGQRAELEGRRARHLAEREGATAIRFDSRFEHDPFTAEIARGEIRLFNENLAVREARRDQLSLQIAQFEEQVRGLTAQQEANANERKMVKEDLERLTPLYNKGFIEIGKIRTMERDLVKIDGLKGEIDANIARVKGQISESRIKIIELDQQARTDGQRDLRDVDGKLAELQERIVASLDRLSRMVIRSPISGTVNELAVNSVNGVIAPKETLMSIVPESADLVVEAKLSPTDIDQATTGQSARLRFSSFNQRTTPEVAGTVETIGAAATLDQASGQTYYLSTIAIAGGQRQVAGKPIVPGMPVEVFLTTGDRTALSYLIKPFTDQMMKSFREE